MHDRPRDSADPPPAPIYPGPAAAAAPADPVSAIVEILARQIVDDHYPETRDTLDPPRGVKNWA